MLDYPITVVLNVFDTLRKQWMLGMGYVILLWHSRSLPYNYLEFFKFMSIQTQEEHIGHIKQSKSYRYDIRIVNIFLSSKT